MGFRRMISRYFLTVQRAKGASRGILDGVGNR
jgi:hypothetical protein